MVHKKILVIFTIFSASALFGAEAASARAQSVVSVSRNRGNRSSLACAWSNATVCDQLVSNASDQAKAVFAKSRPTDSDLALVMLFVNDAVARAAIVGFNCRFADCGSGMGASGVVIADVDRQVLGLLQRIQAKCQQIAKDPVCQDKAGDSAFVRNVKDSSLFSFNTISTTMVAAGQDIVRLQENSATRLRRMLESVSREDEDEI